MFKKLDEKFLKPIDTKDDLKLVRAKHGKNPESMYQIDAKGVIEMDLFTMPMFQGYNYFALFVDIYTRQLYYWISKKKTADILLQALKKAIQFYGKVEYIYADGGGEFKNNKIMKYCEDEDIPIRYSMTNRNANSMVEAYGGIIKKYLNEISAVESLKTKKYDLDWVNEIDAIVIEINKHNKTIFPKPMYEAEEWAIPTKTSPKLGELYHLKIDQPKGLLNNKKLHGNMRYGDLHFEKEPRKIVGILPSNAGAVRYLLEGIPDTSFNEKELLRAKQPKQKK